MSGPPSEHSDEILKDKEDKPLSVVLMCRYGCLEQEIERECVCFSNEGMFVISWREDTPY